MKTDRQPLIDEALPSPLAHLPRTRNDPPVDVAGALRMQRHFHAAGSIPELLRRTSDAAQTAGGFKRAVVLTVAHGHLAADRLPALEDTASDRLRRELLATPLPLSGTTAEADFIRRVESGYSAPARGQSRLEADFGFTHLALGAIMPEDRVVALIVADSETPVGAWGHLILQGVAHLATYALERIVQRQRMTDFREELRYVTVSANAMIGESTAPVGLPEEEGVSQVLSLHPAGFSLAPSPLDEMLTQREMAVAREVAAGRSNRAIAESLHVTEASVKKYVSQIMRKLGTANRAETAVRCMRMSESDQ